MGIEAVRKLVGEVETTLFGKALLRVFEAYDTPDIQVEAAAFSSDFNEGWRRGRAKALKEHGGFKIDELDAAYDKGREKGYTNGEKDGYNKGWHDCFYARSPKEKPDVVVPTDEYMRGQKDGYDYGYAKGKACAGADEEAAYKRGEQAGYSLGLSKFGGH